MLSANLDAVMLSQPQVCGLELGFLAASFSSAMK
jgi:hypothetical protein